MTSPDSHWPPRLPTKEERDAMFAELRKQSKNFLMANGASEPKFLDIFDDQKATYQTALAVMPQERQGTPLEDIVELSAIDRIDAGDEVEKTEGFAISLSFGISREMAKMEKVMATYSGRECVDIAPEAAFEIVRTMNDSTRRSLAAILCINHCSWDCALRELHRNETGELLGMGNANEVGDVTGVSEDDLEKDGGDEEDIEVTVGLYNEDGEDEDPIPLQHQYEYALVKRFHEDMVNNRLAFSSDPR